MIDHLSLGTHRYAEAVAFYERVLTPLGMRLQRDNGKEAGFGTDENWCFWLYPVPKPASLPLSRCRRRPSGASTRS